MNDCSDGVIYSIFRDAADTDRAAKGKNKK